jgi:hypothetical protein
MNITAKTHLTTAKPPGMGLPMFLAAYSTSAPIVTEFKRIRSPKNASKYLLVDIEYKIFSCLSHTGAHEALLDASNSLCDLVWWWWKSAYFCVLGDLSANDDGANSSDSEVGEDLRAFDVAASSTTYEFCR